jgi:hypothetical protein|tara:strand:+ start:8809 stop:9135 length:327 start_codon:yes stop_codon:yes gene_type:complete
MPEVKPTTKQISFEELEGRHLQLAAAVKYDKLSIPEFLRLMVYGYVSGDPNIRKYIETAKEIQHRNSKIKRKITQKEAAKGAEIWEDFNITEDEKRELFDIIEKENSL